MLRILFSLLTVVFSLSGCVSTGELDFVAIEPISFVPVVGKDGPSCQGWCSTTKEQATHFRVSLGRTTFHRVVNEGKLRGKSEDLAFLDFVREQVRVKEVCASLRIKEPKLPNIIHTTQNQYDFWTDITCEDL